MAGEIKMSGGLDSLIAEFQAFAESVGHQQSEDPAEGIVANESCVHCQLILLFIPKLEVYAAAERALREKLEELRNRWKEYIVKMRQGSVNFVHRSVKDSVEMNIEIAQRFVDEITAVLATQGS